MTSVLGPRPPSFEVKSKSSKSEIVGEIVDSSVRLLRLLGFSDTEISHVFDQIASDLRATGQSSPSTAVLLASPPDLEERDSDPQMRVWDIEEEAREQEFARALSRFDRRTSTYPETQTAEQLDSTTGKFIQNFKWLACAQCWYKNKFLEAQIDFHLCRQEWLASASDTMLDREDEIAFLNETEQHQNASLYMLEDLMNDAVRLGRPLPLKRILDAIDIEGFEITNELTAHPGSLDS